VLPAAFFRLRNSLWPLLVSSCASSTGERGLAAVGGNIPGGWVKLGELCMQVVGQRKGCSRCETGLASLARRSARRAWYVLLVLYDAVLSGSEEGCVTAWRD